MTAQDAAAGAGPAIVGAGAVRAGAVIRGGGFEARVRGVRGGPCVRDAKAWNRRHRR